MVVMLPYTALCFCMPQRASVPLSVPLCMHVCLCMLLIRSGDFYIAPLRDTATYNFCEVRVGLTIVQILPWHGAPPSRPPQPASSFFAVERETARQKQLTNA